MSYKLLAMNFTLLHYVVSPTHLSHMMHYVIIESGELFTWGKAGPHLGYTTTGNKQLEPRLVEQLSNRRMRHVACGALHTIG